MSSPQLQQRRDAARELTSIEPMPPEVIEPLAHYLETAEPNDAGQRYAITGLAKSGSRAIPAVAKLLDSKNPVVYGAAVEVLGRMSPSVPAARPIMIAYFKRAPEVVDVAYNLARAGPPLVPLLRQALKDPDPRTRMGAAATLAEMADFAHTNANASAQARAQSGFAFVTPEDLGSAAPELAVALRDPDANVRNWAAIALAYAAAADVRSIPILVALLDKGDIMLTYGAISALENMGRAAEPALPGLERALVGNQNSVVRVGVARILVLAGGARACTPLAHAVTNDKDGSVRAAAADSLIAIHPPCPQTVRVLLANLGRQQYWLSDEIAKLGESAVPGLAAALKSPDLYVRQDAVAALAKIKPLSPKVKRALMVALKDKSLDVTSAAATALQNAGGAAERAAAAEQAHEQKIYEQRSKPDTRKYTRREIMEPVPPDPDHKHPLTLSYLVPVAAIGEPTSQARILIALYTGEDRPERLVFWKKVGQDAWQQLKVMESDDLDFRDDHYDTPNIFKAKARILGQDHPREETQQFVDVPMDGYRSHTDNVFAVVEGELHPVEIESAEDWYRPRLRPRESIQFPASNEFSDYQLEFSLGIWNADDPICCATAGSVTGTYQIVRDREPGGSGTAVVPGHPEARAFFVSPAVTIWKMVIVSAKRGPADTR